MASLTNLIGNCCRRDVERVKVKQRKASNYNRNAAGKKLRHSREHVSNPVRGSKEPKDEKNPKGSKINKIEKKQKTGSRESIDEKKPKAGSKEDSSEEQGGNNRESARKKSKKRREKKGNKSDEVPVPAAGGHAESVAHQGVPETSRPSQEVKAGSKVHATKKLSEESFVDYWLQPDGKTNKPAATKEQPCPKMAFETKNSQGIDLSVVNEPLLRPGSSAVLHEAKPQKNALKENAPPTNVEEGVKQSTQKLGLAQPAKLREQPLKVLPQPDKVEKPIACQKATEKPPTPLPQQQEQQQAIPGSGEPRNKPATPIKYRPSPMYTSCMAWDSHTTKQAVSTPLLDGMVKAEVKVVKLPDPPAPQMCVSLPQPPVEQAGVDLVVLPTTPATVLPTKAPAPQINPNNSAGTPSENPIQSEFFDLAEHY